MYKTILAPLDGSKRAEAILPHVEEVARRYDATVIFMQVIEQTMLFVEPHTAFIEQDQFEEIAKQAEVYLEGFGGEFRKKGIGARTPIAHGPIVVK